MKIETYDKINETLYSYVHPTGVKVFLVRKPGFSKSCASFSTRFGSIDNTFVPIGEQEMITVPDGVAHFLEHKAFEQEDGGNVFELFGKLGASANAYTSFNLTNYYFWCTSNFEENLKILIQFVQAPYFTEENVQKEQGIIGQEIQMYDDNPEWRCYFNMLSTIFEKHPVRVDIAGTIETISNITKDTLYQCYNTFYHPSNMYLCAVGDFDIDSVVNTIDQALKPLEAVPAVPRKYPEETQGVAQKEIRAKLPVATPVFCIGFKDNKQVSGDELIARRVAVSIALGALFGKSSPFYEELYQQNSINASFAYDYSGEESYAFVEISGESPDPDKVGKAVLKTVQETPFSQEDFERTKRLLSGRLLRELDDPEEYNGKLARYATQGLDMFRVFDLYEQVTYEDVKKVCGEILKEENYCISIVSDK